MSQEPSKPTRQSARDDSDLPELLREHPSDALESALRPQSSPIKLTRRDRMLLFSASPLGPMWLLTAFVLVGGVIHSAVTRQVQWESLGAAGVIASSTRIMAKRKGIAPWPWSDPRDIEHDDDD